MHAILNLENGIKTRILYQDALLLLAEKPAGIPVHETKDPNRPDFTRLLQKELELPWLRCVNRLDLLTTGIVVFALNPEKNAEVDAILTHSKKYYQAIVKGHINKTNFTIESFLKDGNHKVQTVRSGGKKAITRFQVIDYDRKNDRTLVVAELVTGRRHQIRIHLAELGHPIVGDPVYGKESNQPISPLLKKGKLPSIESVMFLHAWKLVLPQEKYNCLHITSDTSWTSDNPSFD